MSVLDLFHFTRPLWLLVLPALALVWWLVRRRELVTDNVASIVAPHLAEALTVNAGAQRGYRPVDGLTLVGVLGALAAAGPTWSKQPSPWFAETAPLVIAVEVSDSMRSNDLQPTRLDRARFKVADLIAARTGARTALVAYAGTAHLVMPPTKDEAVLQPFLENLDPAMMPEPGGNAGAVLPLARGILGDRDAVGTVLFVNDGFDPADLPALRAFAAEPGTPGLAALVVGTDEGGVALLPDGSAATGPGGGRVDTTIDPAQLRQAAAAGDMTLVRAEIGDTDIRRLLLAIDSNLQLADDPDARWTEQGWWLLWPAALLTLLWFRRGWTMRW